MSDLERKDKCLPPEGELFSGGYALIHGGQPEFLGKVVFLVEKDKFGWWESIDRAGDMLVVDANCLMPLSIEGWDDKTDLDTFLYEVRYGS